VAKTSGLMLLVCTVFTAAAVAGPPIILDYTLTDLNSSASFNVGSDVGQHNWTVDGTNHLTQEWFWYSIGATDPRFSLDSIGSPLIKALDANFNDGLDTLYVRYTAPSFVADLAFVLTGGSDGSGKSDVATSISIRNTSGDVLPFHFFDFANFDLNGSASNDSVELVSPNVIRQTKGSVAVLETVLTPAASQMMMGQTPGDATWTIQWDANIAPGGTLLISKDQQITPEPTSFLFLLASAGLLRLRRQRR
jgi:hypothetical protein